MKVAMVDPSLFTPRYDDALCAGLARAGHEVRLIGRPLRATDWLEPQGYAYYPRYFPVSERLRSRLGEGRAFRLLKGGEYLAQSLLPQGRAMAGADAVHVQWLPLARVDSLWLRRLAARENRPALIHTVHNAQAYHGDSGAQGAGYDDLLRLFDRLIVHGEDTRAALEQRGLARERIDIIPHPPIRLAHADAAAMAAVPDTRVPRVLLFGTLRPYKGFDLLIEACLRLWRAGAAFELAVAGKPFMDVEPLLERVRAAGFGDRLILSLDFLKEEALDAHIRKADILAFPYRHIDSSGAFLSSLHYGKAMLCARVGMFARLDAGAVALVPPEDAAALTGALEALVRDRDRRAAHGQAALRLEREMGGWRQAALDTAQAYARAREGMN